MTFIQTLKHLVSVPSVTSDKLSCLNLLKSVHDQLVGSKIDEQNRILVWGHTDLTTSKWLINTHLDVVPGKLDQFSLKITGDKVWGRGVADVKGCATILIDQFKNWHEIARQKKITFMLVIDEEIGGPSTKSTLVKMKDLKGAVFLEPTNLHIIREAKGMMQLKIVASGKSVHGSIPWAGINAIERIATGLAKFRLDHPRPLTETRDTTFNFSQIQGGSAINQVPDYAELWCDVRTSLTSNKPGILKLISTSFRDCTVSTPVVESPIICPPESEIFTSISDALRHSSINPLTQFSHLTSDARHATALGIPALVFGPKGGNLHADDEWVSLKSLLKVQNVLDHWIKNI